MLYVLSNINKNSVLLIEHKCIPLNFDLFVFIGILNKSAIDIVVSFSEYGGSSIDKIIYCSLTA